MIGLLCFVLAVLASPFKSKLRLAWRSWLLRRFIWRSGLVCSISRSFERGFFFPNRAWRKPGGVRIVQERPLRAAGAHDQTVGNARDHALRLGASE
jgi:hypothetical protein